MSCMAKNASLSIGSLGAVCKQKGYWSYGEFVALYAVVDNAASAHSAVSQGRPARINTDETARLAM